MYELKCPECGQVTRWTFVRIGAVRICAECRHAFQIEKEHVRHRVLPGVPAGHLEEDHEDQAMPGMGVTHDDTALMGHPALVEEDVPTQEALGSQASAGNRPPSQVTEESQSARTPGIVLWAGITLLGLGVLLLLLWLVGAGTNPTRLEGIRPTGEPGHRYFNTSPPSSP